MAVRLRVYPQGANALGGNMGAVSAQTYYNQKLNSQQQVSNLRLQYERALFDQKLDNVRLEERLKNPYAAMASGYGGVMAMPTMMPQLGMLGGLGTVGALPVNAGLPIGGQQLMLPQTGLGGAGQTNITNQVSPGGSPQSVTNSNVTNLSHVSQPAWGPPFGMSWGGGGGGFLSSLLGALI